jgi:hypothetical protein
MKGVVFTEFLEMVEERFSIDMVDDLLDDAQPASGGAYTSVGTYDHAEMVALVRALAERTRMSSAELLCAFGERLFGRFVVAYPRFFDEVTTAFQFLAGIEDIIHAEVRKLYPDAELPAFEVERHEVDELVLVYDSGRHLEDLAEGLIRGCGAYFGEHIVIARSTLGEGASRRERFVLTHA